MAINGLDQLEIIETMVNYIENIRPPLELRDKVDVDYKQDKQSIILFEIRPSFFNPKEKVEIPFAKATFVKEKKDWKIFWKRASGKWENYKPVPQVASLKEFIKIVEEDQYGCFLG